MKSEDVQNLLNEAKAIRGSASPLVIDEMLGRLIALVTMLLASKDTQAGELAKLRTIVFGSKSENLDRAEDFVAASAMPQPDTDDGPDVAPSKEEIELQVAALQQIKDLTAEARRLTREMSLKKKPSRGLSPRPELQPEIEIVRHPLPEDLNVNCPLCGDAVTDRGKNCEAREIDVNQSQYIERTHLLHKGSCGCGALQFVMPTPARGIEGRIYSPAFVAKVIYDKFVLHLPVYRQVKAMADNGVKMSRNVINQLILSSFEVLSPIINRMIELNQQQPYQACDESTVTTVINDKKQKQFLWCLVSVLAVTFKITATRTKAVAREIIGGTTNGALTTDRLSIYWGLFETKAESGCFAHLRRKFWYCLANFPKESITVLRLIGKLYKIERHHKDSSPENRLQARKMGSAPALAKLYAYLHSLNPPPESALGKAIAYAVNHKKALSYFTEDGRVPIDNNQTEGQIRPVKLGFKNFLFTQSNLGTEAVAGMYSLIATCVLHGVNPLAYLADVLARINRGHPATQLDELLPWNWVASAQARPDERAPKIKIVKHTATKIIPLTRLRQKAAALTG